MTAEPQKPDAGDWPGFGGRASPLGGFDRRLAELADGRVEGCRTSSCRTWIQSMPSPSHRVDDGVQAVPDDAVQSAHSGAHQEVDILLGNGLLGHGTPWVLSERRAGRRQPRRAIDLPSGRIDRQRTVWGLAAHQHRISEKEADL